MIEHWRIVMTNEDGIDIDFNTELPDWVTEEIDGLIEHENHVTWGD